MGVAPSRAQVRLLVPTHVVEVAESVEAGSAIPDGRFVAGSLEPCARSTGAPIRLSATIRWAATSSSTLPKLVHAAQREASCVFSPPAPPTPILARRATGGGGTRRSEHWRLCDTASGARSLRRSP